MSLPAYISNATVRISYVAVTTNRLMLFLIFFFVYFIYYLPNNAEVTKDAKGKRYQYVFSSQGLRREVNEDIYFNEFFEGVNIYSRKLTAEKTFYICKLFKCNLPFDTKFAIFSVLFILISSSYFIIDC